MEQALSDLSVIWKAASGGIPLILIVFCGVAFMRKVGVPSVYLPYASLLWGLVLGGGYQLAAGVPSTFAGWFALVIYGLALGFLASLFYDEMKRVIDRLLEKYFPKTVE